jgi:hypothetical protein
MHHCQRKQYFPRHGADTRNQFRPVSDRFPGTDHQSSIAKVKEIIAGQQHPVDKIGQLFILMKQAKDIHPSISIKMKTNVNSNKVSDEQVNDISESVHITGFDLSIPNHDVKVSINFIFSINSEN